ncbi:MAG: bacillopeptidase [Myxococcaceae bacterium]|nr:bacillopeptidase [Myxococcaceae bacterium]
MASKILSLASVASLLALSAVAVTACSSADPATAADGEKVEATDEASSAFGLGNIKISGSLSYGETSSATAYSKTPLYRAFKFAGNAGDEIEVSVKSSNGDPVTWILDNDWHTVAKNDDASASDTSSLVKVKLPANASATHYIVVRDYWKSTMSFTVSLKGGAADFVSGCNTDSDCVKVDKACCANYGSTAVVAGKEAAYKANLHCSAPQICPLFVTRPDFAQPECNQGTHKCEMVKPADIKCGGFIAPAMQHQCPAGYDCNHIGPGLHPDTGGKCVQRCGGFAGIQCNDSAQSCVDDPSDSCDPAHGGADCGGICQ